MRWILAAIVLSLALPLNSWADDPVGREFCYYCSDMDYCMRLYYNLDGNSQGKSQCTRSEHNGSGGEVFYSCTLGGVSCISTAEGSRNGGYGHGSQDQGCGWLTGPGTVENGEPVAWAPQRSTRGGGGS